jgi:hypothetical protein
MEEKQKRIPKDCQSAESGGFLAVSIIYLFGFNAFSSAIDSFNKVCALA